MGAKVTETIILAEKFADSDRFKALFRDGMTLVEESATFLDGEGRIHAKGLPRASAMLYGSESMRLTTRLMQLASWLLLQRSVNVGEMTKDQLLEEKKKIVFCELTDQLNNPAWHELPAEFTSLVSRSQALQNRVVNLDTELYGHRTRQPEPKSSNPVNQQINLLSTVFGNATR